MSPPNGAKSNGEGADGEAAKSPEQSSNPASKEIASAKGAAQKAKGGAIEALKADHRNVEQLFVQYDKAKDPEKKGIIEQLCKALTLHTMLEEEIFYPACREKIEGGDPLNQAQVEHDSAKLIIADLMALRDDDKFRDAKVKVLGEQIKHHVGEEEDGKDGIFAEAEARGVDTPDLAQRLQNRRAELEKRDRLPGGQPVSIAMQPTNNQNREEYEMASNQQSGRDRDDQGRFTGGGRGRDDYDDRGSSARGRERDDEGRFMSWRGGGGRDRNDDDDRGSSSRSSRSRDDDDDDDRSGRRGSNSGWFGDSRGHSEAARKAWESRH